MSNMDKKQSKNFFIHNMAKNIINIILSVTLASVGVLSSALSLSAGEQLATPFPGELDFLEVVDSRLFTSAVFEDGSPVIWSGEDLRSGIQSFSLTLRNGKDIPENFTMPESPTFYSSILNPVGEEIATTEKDISNDFRKLQYVSKFQSNYSASLTVNRGGQYTIKAGFSPNLFSYEKSIILNEEAGAQVLDKTFRADSVLSPKVAITSGYPYDPTAVAGQHSLRWTVITQEEPYVLIADNTIPFELSSDTPLLAAVADVTLSVSEVAPGDYIFTLSSDYAPANRTFKARVNDYLRVESSFDKMAYKTGEDKVVILKMDMNYGFPYIKANSSTNKPTISVTTLLLDDSKTTEFSDEAWADAPMQYTADVEIPLEAVTREIVEDYEGKVPVTVSVAFNSTLQYKATMFIPFEYQTSGIENVVAAPSLSGNVQFFNLLGVEVDENYKGLIITSDGHKFIRR